MVNYRKASIGCELSMGKSVRYSLPHVVPRTWEHERKSLDMSARRNAFRASNEAIPPDEKRTDR